MGGWETIALPFDVTHFSEPETFCIESLVGQKEGEDILLFEIIKEWKANQPYIMRYMGEDKGETRSVHFTAGEGILIQTINADPSSIFKANYNASVSAEGLYILRPDGTAFGKGTPTATITPFRGYIEFDNQSNLPHQFTLQHGDGTTSVSVTEKTNNIYTLNGVLYIHSSENQLITIYSIDGRKVLEKTIHPGLNTVEGLVKGVYVVNNQKAVIK